MHQYSKFNPNHQVQINLDHTLLKEEAVTSKTFSWKIYSPHLWYQELKRVLVPLNRLDYKLNFLYFSGYHIVSRMHLKHYPALSNPIEYISIIVSKVGILFISRNRSWRKGIKIFKPMIDVWISDNTTSLTIHRENKWRRFNVCGRFDLVMPPCLLCTLNLARQPFLVHLQSH